MSLVWGFQKGVTQLAKEMEHKLEEAEQQCRESTKSSLEECKPCLEDTCKAFYASTCRRGFASFSFKVLLQLQECDSCVEQEHEFMNLSSYRSMSFLGRW